MTEKQQRLTYKPKEIAELLGIGNEKVYNLINRADFPKIKVGARHIIPKEAFHKWLNDVASADLGNNNRGL